MKPTAEERRHWHEVREAGCILTQLPNPTIHHCHGGSMLPYVRKGIGLKTSNWLVLPLDAPFHCFGEFAIDGAFGVKKWEATFGSQLYWLLELRKMLGYNFFERAGIDMPADFTTTKYPEES